MVTELQLSDYPLAGSLPYYYCYVTIAAEMIVLQLHYDWMRLAREPGTVDREKESGEQGLS
jgi:hypothetical protein